MKHNANRLREIAQDYQYKEQQMTATKYQQYLINHYAGIVTKELQDNASAELQTFCAIAVELMKTATPSRLRDAARLVEMRHMTKELR